MHLTIGIATSGRREIATRLVQEMARQTRLPDEVVVCPAKPADFVADDVSDLPFPVRIVSGPVGLPAQRNCILRACRDTEVILFLDDDFIPATDYYEQCVAIFEADPSLVICTGTVLADGVGNAGYNYEQSQAFIAADMPPASHSEVESYGGYGCNMALLNRPIVENDLLFDEALPLYGWLEDVDFSRRLAPYGRIIRTTRCRGVHMGDKKGRTSGVRFGYSQIANPIHMVRKGSMHRSYAAKTMIKNIIANTVRSLAPEPWVDRLGRLEGNGRGLFDWMTGRLDPRKILEFK